MSAYPSTGFIPGSRISSFFKNMLQGLGRIIGVVGRNVVAKYLGTQLTGAEKESWSLSEQSAQNQRAWEEQMSNTSHQRGVADMQAAGLNPALMYGSASGASTPAGASGNAPSPSGAGLSELLGLLLLPAQKKQIETSIEANKASIGKTIADTKRTTAETEKISKETSWIDKLNAASLEAQNVHIRLTEEQIEQTKTAMREAEERIHRTIAETKNEEEKKALIEAQRILSHAQASEIYALLPFKQDNLSASTDLQKAQRSLALVQAAYQQRLIDGGYIDAMCSQMSAAADSAEAKAAVDELRSAMRTGHATNDKVAQWLDRNVPILSPNVWISALTNLVDLVPLSGKL